MFSEKDLKKILSKISDSDLLNLSIYTDNIKVKSLFEKFHLDLTKDLDTLGMLLYDIKNDYYTDIDNRVYFILALFAIYIIMPNSVLEPLIGKKNFFKTGLLLLFSGIYVNEELKKYKAFISDKECLFQTEYGTVKYYTHRIER
ncbi:MAG: hypothetical protein MSH08_05825 [Ezakiella sp.]|nr:hypothetical protein [Ezakiella sp.]MDD7471843.1 hypothetical protein [Bacillota bacterium]MDY3923807.1 hypothetical protein [Ezakiella sp.]